MSPYRDPDYAKKYYEAKKNTPQYKEYVESKKLKVKQRNQEKKLLIEKMKPVVMAYFVKMQLKERGKPVKNDKDILNYNQWYYP